MWSPPDQPDPSEIYDSAREDIRVGRHEQALAKMLWFHENATRYEPGLAAVRLSYALGDWFKLAQVYSPAMTAIVQTRDETEASLRTFLKSLESSTSSRSRAMHTCAALFQEIAALNRTLGERKRQAELFLEIAQQDHDLAQLTYSVAERYLVDAGWYHKCGPFLEPDQRMKFVVHMYRFDKDMEESRLPSEPKVPKTADNFFMHNVSTLVALLVLNNRHDEAGHVYNNAVRVLDNDEFLIMLKAALAGQAPKARWH